MSPEAGGLEAAGALLAAHDWEAAYAVLAPAPEGAPPEWLDRLADAAWWVGRLDECITAREAAYRAYEEAGAPRAAGRCAAWLFEHHRFRAQPAIARGWLRRARRMLDDQAGTLEYGYLLLRETEGAHGEGDLDLAADRAREALALGRTLRSPDLEADALQALGRVLIDQGAPSEGLAHLDEAMLYAIEGRLSPYTTGKVYCSLVSACEELGDLHRAAEWTDAVASWSDRHPVSLFPGLCRVHRAELLQWRGAWVEAEAEARLACDELRGMNLPNAAAGFVKIAEIRQRLGDHDGAEDAFRRAEELNGQAWAGLALLRLAQGRADSAAAIVTRALGEASWNRLARGKLLPSYIEVMVATGDVASAAAAADELQSIADDYESPVLLAAAATARARVLLREGDAPAACATLHEALARWQELDVPYEVATTRLLMGQACRQAGDEDGAEGSFRAAASIFERLGAAVDVERTRGMLQPAALPCGLTPREAEVLRLVAGGLTNRQIAAELFLSQKTVSRHLSNIFAKIGVATRAAATAFAFEQRLVR